jgi:hypothetical protein
MSTFCLPAIQQPEPGVTNPVPGMVVREAATAIGGRLACVLRWLLSVVRRVANRINQLLGRPAAPILGELTR